MQILGKKRLLARRSRCAYYSFSGGGGGGATTAMKESVALLISAWAADLSIVGVPSPGWSPDRRVQRGRRLRCRQGNDLQPPSGRSQDEGRAPSARDHHQLSLNQTVLLEPPPGIRLLREDEERVH